MPMAPAIRPARNCWAPSSVEIDWAVACVKLSGRAPYLSWFARVVADSWVKLPEISVPPAIAWLIRGAETTRPSSVMPTELPTFAAVYLAHLAEPADLKTSWTIHSPVVDRRSEQVLGRAVGRAAGDVVGRPVDRRAQRLLVTGQRGELGRGLRLGHRGRMRVGRARRGRRRRGGGSRGRRCGRGRGRRCRGRRRSSRRRGA